MEFDALSPAAIDAYVASGEPFDKAGSYGAHVFVLFLCCGCGTTVLLGAAAASAVLQKTGS